MGQSREEDGGVTTGAVRLGDEGNRSGQCKRAVVKTLHTQGCVWRWREETATCSVTGAMLVATLFRCENTGGAWTACFPRTYKD